MSRAASNLFPAFAALVTATLAIAATSVAQDAVIIPGGVVMPDGTIAANRAVVVRDGAIAAIEDATAYDESADALRRPGAVLSPGLVDPYSVLGVVGGNTENTHSIDPGLSVIDAINWWDPGWASAIEGGITTVMIVPGANNLVGGTTAVIRTGNARRAPEALREHAAMLVSLGPPALNPRRAPTSRGGAITLLRSAMTQARSGDAAPRLKAILDGELAAIVRADGGEDVTAAIRFFEGYGLVPTIVHRNELLDVIDDIVDAQATVILGPYGFDATAPMLAAPARLAVGGVDFAFAGNTPVRDGAALRFGAALAVRAGLDPATARRAMTVNSARLLGVADRVGSIEPGRDADLVLFSADPLRPDARVLEVWLRGELVHAAPDLADEILRLESESDGESADEAGIEEETE